MTAPTGPAPHAPAAKPRGRYLAALSLGALGVVYGDIGTSPLYALKACFEAIPATHDNVLGILSLIFWVLTILVSLWYLLIVLRADNRGEGGILALTALFGSLRDLRPGVRRPLFAALGIFGAALLYGDGMITPVISVLGAVEGLHVAAPAIGPYVQWIAIVILIVLFSVQRHGTAKVGSMFGPITLVWFATIGVLGVVALVRNPAVLAAVNPAYAVRFLAHNGGTAFVVMGSVFLVVTGAEALYADLGHFGARPIRIAWYTVAMPALLLNYFGQGALLLHDAQAAHNPFFELAPQWFAFPLFVIATLAAAVASQAVISGAFSMTRQAVQLGLAPRLTVRHTSAREIGQIYVPSVNWILLLSAIGLVLYFQTTSRLGAAYGVAVTLTMAITTFLMFRVMRQRWRIPLLISLVAVGVVLSIDLAFFGANALKILHGGWFPLAIGAIGYLLMATWQRGRAILAARLNEIAVPLQILLGDIAAEPPLRVAGTAVFMSAQREGVPYTLIYNLRHNHVLHERNIFLTLQMLEVARIDDAERVDVETIAEDFYRVTARYGFQEEPDVMEVLALCRAKGLDIAPEATSFFLGRETLLSTDRPGMPKWRERLFAIMSRNSPRAPTAFNVPAGQVIEIGAQIEL
jgi:KUP system potassium uptake protein